MIKCNNKVLDKLVENGVVSVINGKVSVFLAYVQEIDEGKMHLQYAIGDNPHNFMWVPETKGAEVGGYLIVSLKAE